MLRGLNVIHHFIVMETNFLLFELSILLEKMSHLSFTANYNSFSLVLGKYSTSAVLSHGNDHVEKCTSYLFY